MHSRVRRPEIVSGQAIDGRADLYALGVTTFEALTGRLPYRDSTPFELLRLHVEAAAPRVRELRHEVSGELEAIVARLLEKEPQARFPTCESVLSALQAKPVAIRRANSMLKSSCPACGEPGEPTWPICPACGALGERHAEGEWMVVLMRAPENSARALQEVLKSVGAMPAGRSPRELPERPKGFPRCC